MNSSKLLLIRTLRTFAPAQWLFTSSTTLVSILLLDTIHLAEKPVAYTSATRGAPDAGVLLRAARSVAPGDTGSMMQRKGRTENAGFASGSVVFVSNDRLEAPFCMV